MPCTACPPCGNASAPCCCICTAPAIMPKTPPPPQRFSRREEESESRDDDLHSPPSVPSCTLKSHTTQHTQHQYSSSWSTPTSARRRQTDRALRPSFSPFFVCVCAQGSTQETWGLHLNTTPLSPPTFSHLIFIFSRVLYVRVHLLHTHMSTFMKGLVCGNVLVILVICRNLLSTAPLTPHSKNSVCMLLFDRSRE